MRILIAGDSWGCGVWDSDFAQGSTFYLTKNKIKKPTWSGLLHKGVELFLSIRGFEVTNVSQSAYSNFNIYESLLKIDDLNQFNFIFIFYTNPFRDMCKNFAANQFTFNPKLLEDPELNVYLNVENYSLTYRDYVKMNHILIHRFKSKLESLDYNKPLFLLGGHQKIDTSLFDSNKIQILIPSLREYFYKNFTEPTILYTPAFDDLLGKFDLETLEKFKIERNYFKNLPNIQKEYFYPDGFHLNTKGHKILADFLADFIQSQ